MEIPFKIYYPGGNTTALVETSVPLDFSAIAKLIMKKNSEIEQVGFLMPPKKDITDFHVEMMGGEFCCNAARCAAFAWFESTKKDSAIFTVSGFEVPMTAHITAGTVTLRIPGEFLRVIESVPEGWLVDFYGIRFLVTEQEAIREEIDKVINKYQDNVPAMGFITLQTSAQGHSISPWVWVKSTGTLVQETACASGSIAASFVLRHKGLELPSYSIIQPSGSVLSVGIEQQFLDITISGIVEPTAEGKLDFN